jgi:hypothetical protein
MLPAVEEKSLERFWLNHALLSEAQVRAANSNFPTIRGTDISNLKEEEVLVRTRQAIVKDSR